jgi:integrase
VGVPAALAFTLSAAQTVTAEIQAQLGHSKAATTSRYIKHIAPQQLISTTRQRTWHAS